MFIDNKYTRIYFAIITKHASIEGEKHHIIPKSLGGSNDRENLITVQPRVHFILHKLLCRMVEKKNHKKSMYFALFQMMNRKITRFSSRDYESTKRVIKEQMKINNPMHDPETLSKFIGRKRPDQSEVAKKRNAAYWSDRARPERTFDCPICSTRVTTRVPTQTTCSKSCSAKLQHRKEPVLFLGGAHTQ